jgi:ABC-type Fe3+-hydroxamate transport system substrate-binding protein
LASALAASCAACSPGDGASAAQPDAAPRAAPAPVAGAAGAAGARGDDPQAFVPAERPRRIVPANVAAAEFVCPLIGLERIAALPDQLEEGFSSLALPDGAGDVPRFHTYTAEAVLGFEPDLVFVHPWQSQETNAFLRGRGVPVVVLPSATSWDDVRTTLLAVARVLEAEEAAQAWIAELDRRVEALAAGAGELAHLRLLVYSNTGTGGWSPGKGATSDTMIRMAGMRNAATEAGIVGHERVDFERFLTLDPDVVVVNELAAGTGASATQDILLSAPALAGLDAIRERRIVVLPADLMSADSPRIVDAAERLARDVGRLYADGD